MRRHGRRVDGTAHIELAENLLRLALLHDHDVAVFIADINLAVDQQRRRPDGSEQIVIPVLHTCLRIERVQETTEVSLVDDAVLDCRRGNGTTNLVEVPNETSLRDVTTLGRVDTVHVTDAFTVFGILAVGNVDVVFVDYGSADKFVARLGPD